MDFNWYFAKQKHDFTDVYYYTNSHLLIKKDTSKKTQ